MDRQRPVHKRFLTPCSQRRYACETLADGQPPVPYREAAAQLCREKAHAFNPLLLECLQEIGPELGDSMDRRQGDTL